MHTYSKSVSLLTLVLTAALVLVLCFFALPAEVKAQGMENGFYYEIHGDEAVIVDTDWDLGGDVVIPDTLGGYPVTGLDHLAFFSREGLTSLTIPKSVTDIASNAIIECYALTAIWVEEGNPNYCSDSNGNLFNKEKTQLLRVPCGISGAFQIPESVTVIGENAFSDCKWLTSVTIPEGVVLIDAYAFTDCESLTAIQFPKSLERIDGQTFPGCSSLKTVDIPKGVKFIGNGAFAQCSNLTGIRVAAENQEYCSDSKGVLFTKDKTQLRQIPGGFSGSYTIPDGVKELYDDAASGCEKLTELVIPEGMENLGYSSLQNCKGLTSLNLPASLREIHFGCFSGCSNLAAIWVDEKNPYFSSDSYGVVMNKEETELLCIPGGISGDYRIPASITVLEEYLFEGCEKLTSVTIPDGVTEIPYALFIDCDGLTSVHIPDSVRTIGDWAFGGCDKLESVVIPDGVTEIPYCAFNGCISLTALNIPVSVKTIGEYALPGYGCTLYYAGTRGQWDAVQIENLYNIAVVFSDSTGLDYCYSVDSGEVTIEEMLDEVSGDIVFPASLHGYPVTTIMDYAFYYQENLTSVTIPETMTNIGGGAFAACPKLTGIWVDPENPNYSNDSTGVLYNKDYTRLQQVPASRSGAYTVADSVTAIHTEAFAGCNEITTITIPDSVVSIDHYAFDMCEGLKTIQIPTSVTDIAASAFSGCSGLDGIWVHKANPNYSSDGKGAVYNKAYTELLHVPCNTSGAYTVADGITAIGEYAFTDCKDLTAVSIPDSVKTIGGWAFLGCEKLQSVVIPDGVTEISSGTFYRCSSLSSVSIPASVTDIFSSAFYKCDALRSVYYAGTQEDWDQIFVDEWWNESLGKATIYYNSDGAINCDFTGDNQVTDADAVYLLRHTLFPEDFPISGNGDVNKDGILSDADAVYLLRHTLFPEEFPL